MATLLEPETQIQEREAPAVRGERPAEAETARDTHRFAFVIHPLSVKYIHRHFPWTRYLPDTLVEWMTAYRPPFLVSRITGGQSPVTGQKIEGYLFALSATPRQMLRRNARFTYAKLHRIARKPSAGSRVPTTYRSSPSITSTTILFSRTISRSSPSSSRSWTSSASPAIRSARASK